MPWTLNMCHSSHLDAFFPVKINKIWNFCLQLWFFRNSLLQRIETSAIGFGTPWTLNMHHSRHFDAFSQSKSTKCEIFGYLLKSPWQKLKKKHRFVQGKSVWKGLKICTLGFLGMWIAMHYVRTLCDKYFLSYDGFSCCTFIEKTSVKQSMKCKVCSNFQMSFLHLGQMAPNQRHLVADSSTSQRYPAQNWVRPGCPELRCTPPSRGI